MQYNNVIERAKDEFGADDVEKIPHEQTFIYKNFADLIEEISSPPISKQSIVDEERDILIDYIVNFDRILNNTDKKRIWENFKFAVPLDYFFQGSCFFGDKQYTFAKIIEGNSEAQELFKIMKEELINGTIIRLNAIQAKIPKTFLSMFGVAQYRCLCQEIPLIFTTQAIYGVNFPEDFINLVSHHKEIMNMLDEANVSLLLAKYWYYKQKMLKKINFHLIESEQIQRTKIKRYLKEELAMASREPTQKESHNLTWFRRVANEYCLKEIRVIDAESLIKAYNLTSMEKNHLIQLLKDDNLQDIYAEIDFFLKHSCIFDEPNFCDILPLIYEQIPSIHHFILQIPLTFKNFIEYCLKAAAERSKLRREQIITLIAWSRAISPMISELECWPEAEQHIDIYPRPIHFLCSYSGNYMKYNTISLDFFHINASYVEGLDTNFGFTPIPILERIEEVLFHEIDHLTAGFLAARHASSSLIASKGFFIKRNEAAIKHNIQKIKMLNSNQLKQIFESIVDKCAVFNLKNEAGTSVVDYIMRYYSNDRLYVLIELFQSTSELMQILGLYENHHTLYLYMGSDFFSEASEGNFLRVSHLIFSIFKEHTDLIASSASKTAVNLHNHVDKVQLNKRFFTELLKACGMNLEMYREIAQAKDLLINFWIIPTKSLAHILKYSHKVCEISNNQLLSTKKKFMKYEKKDRKPSSFIPKI